MKILSIVIALLISSCASSPFFNAHVYGPYVHKFDGQIECAIVEGWSIEKKCFCKIQMHEAFGSSVVFLAMEKQFCETNNDNTKVRKQ